MSLTAGHQSEPKRVLLEYKIPLYASLAAPVLACSCSSGDSMVYWDQANPLCATWLWASDTVAFRNRAYGRRFPA